MIIVGVFIYNMLYNCKYIVKNIWASSYLYHCSFSYCFLSVNKAKIQVDWKILSEYLILELILDQQSQNNNW